MNFPDAHPLVLGTVTTAAGLRYLSHGKLPADAVEVRVDALLAAQVPLEKIETALKKKKHPVLLTLRIPSEGGQRAWKVAERSEVYLRLLPLVEAIDVELASAKSMRPVIDEARRTKKTVVLSAHAIERPATTAQVARWVAQFDHQPSTILKIAARIKSWRDLQQLAALLVNHPEWPLAVMGSVPTPRNRVRCSRRWARDLSTVSRPRRRAWPALGRGNPEDGAGRAKLRRIVFAAMSEASPHALPFVDRPGRRKRSCALSAREMTFHLTGEHTARPVYAGHHPSRQSASDGPPPHYHENEDECFLVQEGKMSFFIAGQWHDIGAGHGRFRSEALRAHAEECRRHTGPRAGVSLARNGFEVFFATCEEEFADQKPGGPDMDKIVVKKAISSAHGIHYV